MAEPGLVNSLRRVVYSTVATERAQGVGLADRLRDTLLQNNYAESLATSEANSVIRELDRDGVVFIGTGPNSGANIYHSPSVSEALARQFLRDGYYVYEESDSRRGGTQGFTISREPMPDRPGRSNLVRGAWSRQTTNRFEEALNRRGNKRFV